MNAYEVWEIRQAWQIALQARTCPPWSVLVSDAVETSLTEHLKRCPFCAEELEHKVAGEVLHEIDRNYFAASQQTELAATRREPDQVLDAPSIFESRPTRAHPGELWSLKKNLAGWGPGARYYNVPMVLVLEVPANLDGGVQVVQVYDDQVLRGPGDVALDPEDPDLFAESWNTYTLRNEDLAVFVSTVQPDIFEQVRTAASGAKIENEHGDSPLCAFRRLEIEVGAFFSIQAVSELMARRENDVFTLLEERFPDWASLRTELSEKYPRMSLPLKAPSVLEGLLQSHLPADDVAQAAATISRLQQVNVVWLKDDEIRIETGLAEIFQWDVLEDGLVLGGRMVGQIPDRIVLHAMWEKPDGSMQAPAESQVNERGLFRIRFTSLDSVQVKRGRLLAVIGGE